MLLVGEHHPHDAPSNPTNDKGVRQRKKRERERERGGEGEGEGERGELSTLSKRAVYAAYGTTSKALHEGSGLKPLKKATTVKEERRICRRP